MGTKEVKNFGLHVDMQCRCIGCIKKMEKAMTSIAGFNGVETSMVDIDRGIVTVVGKVNPMELRNWLKSKIKKDVKIIYPNPPYENPKQKLRLVMRSITKTGDPTPSAPPLPDQMSWALVPSGVQSDIEYIHLIEEKIRELEKIRDLQKIKSLENELVAVKCELEHCKKVIDSNKQALLDGALNQLKAYKKLEALM